MRKRVFEHMWAANAQISLRIRAVRSGPSLSEHRSFDTIECFNGDKCPDETFAHVQDVVTPHILRMREGTYSLDTVQILLVNEF